MFAKAWVFKAPSGSVSLHADRASSADEAQQKLGEITEYSADELVFQGLKKVREGELVQNP